MSEDIKLRRRMVLLGSAATLAASFAFSAGSLAQDTAAEDEDRVEEVVVTGSRIVRQDLEAASPLQVVSSFDIELANQTNIGDLLAELPAVGAPGANRFNTSFSVGAAGLSTIDLRGLGSARTLTLQNGRRVVSGSPGSSAVDFNFIPSQLVERIEIVTGGGAASYGSDAIAGVINFILKDDFEGIEATVRQQWTESGVGDDINASLLVGGNFDDDKGNATFLVSYSDQEIAPSSAFERSRTDQFSANSTGGGSASPFDVTRPFFSSGTPNGRFFVGGTTGDNFTFRNGTLINDFDVNGTRTGVADGFNRAAFRTVATPVERLTANANISYQINESVKLYSELSYARYESASIIEPFFFAADDAFPDSGEVPIRYQDSNGDIIVNPLIPQAIVDSADANGETGFGFFRRLVEFGPRTQGNTRQTFRWAGGLQGTLDTANISWELGYVYGSSTRDDQSNGQIDTQSVREALLVETGPDGQLRCVSADARATGCVPLNIFGAGNISQDAVDFIAANGQTISSIEQNIIHGYLTGDAFELPGGPLGFAVGFEYREEESSENRDSLVNRGLSAGNAIFSTEGSFHTTEGFIEVNAPLISDDGIHYLGLNGSLRVADYSSVGTVESYHGGIEFAPVEDIRFRASYARTVRAPNIDELFSAGGETFATVTDPCNGVTATTTGTVAENCRSIPEIAARIARDGAFTLSQTELQGTGGFVGANPVAVNPNAAQLTEETADVYTVGAVFTPTFLPDNIRFTATVDYFDISIDQAIAGIGRQTALNICFNSAGLSNPLCSAVIRFGANDPSSGALDRVDSILANLASTETSGIDFAANLSVDADTFGMKEGVFTFSTNYTHLIKLEDIPLPGEDVQVSDGEVFAPANRATFNLGYRNDRLSITWQTRYFGKQRLNDNTFSDAECESIDCFVNTQFINDLQIRYTLPESLLGQDGIEVFGGIENVFDKDAPFYPTGLPGNDPSSQTIGEFFNPLGRQFYLGLRVKL